jgi:hypothetical protein
VANSLDRVDFPLPAQPTTTTRFTPTKDATHKATTWDSVVHEKGGSAALPYANVAFRSRIEHHLFDIARAYQLECRQR